MTSNALERNTPRSLSLISYYYTSPPNFVFLCHDSWKMSAGVRRRAGIVDMTSL